MKKIRFVLFITTGIILLIISIFWLQRNKPVTVSVVEVEKGEIQHTVTNTRAGTLNACRRAKLSPSLGGQIASLPVKEGEAVQQGQVLFEIWNNDLRAQLQLAEAELMASQSLQQQACIQSELASKEATRMNELLARGLASDEVAEKAEGESRASKAACEAAQASKKVSSAKYHWQTRLLKGLDWSHRSLERLLK